MNEEQIFARAIEMEDNRRRSAYLNDVCGGDDTLRAQVEALLVAHQVQDCILDAPANQVIDRSYGNGSTPLLGDFAIIREIGRGGMGIVYEARQRSLNRRVALKVLSRRIGLAENAIVRFRREAEAAAKLHHTNIVPIYHTGEEDGSYYYAMELIDGPSLDRVIEHMRVGPTVSPPNIPNEDVRESAGSGSDSSLANDTVAFGGADRSTFDRKRIIPSSRDSSSPLVDTDQFDRIAEMIAQVADALHHAHQNGVIHRDIKPANLLLAPDGRLSVTDFGIARMLELPGMTLTGEFMGTPRYMSPEQIAAGRISIDHRTDIYSLGATLYELITFEPPFASRQRDQLLSEILHKEPKLPRRANRSIPKDLEAICLKAMTKDPDQRYQSAKEMADDLRRYIGRDVVHAKRITLIALATKFIRRHRVAVSTGCILSALIFSTFFLWLRGQRKDEARRKLPEIAKIIEDGDHAGAYEVLRKLSKVLPGDPIIAELTERCSNKCSVRSEPEGAAVYRTCYDGRPDDWELIGTTPIEDVRLAKGFYIWRLEKAGYRDLIRCSSTGDLDLHMDEESSLPQEMVKVIPGGFLGIYGFNIRSVTLYDYLIDRTEVTNRQFKEFVDAGGYSRQEFWKHPIERNGRELPWKEGVALFRDQTEAPGPTTWRDGSFPEGQGDHPVRGVSWYEAAAFAEFAGKELPTVYHWFRASGAMRSHRITVVSNFDGVGPTSVLSQKGIGPYGTYDMAGNVREWCWNENGTGECYALGGAWSDPEYMFFSLEARPRWDRDETIGFRCAKYIPGHQPPQEAFATVSRTRRDYSKEAPVSDDAYQVIEAAYSYDRSVGFGEVEIMRTAEARFVHETIKVDSPYGDNRLVFHLFLPSNGRPPYQTVVFFPGIWAFWRESIDRPNPDFVVKEGRALLWPEYEGTITRRKTSSSDRDLAIHQFVDLRRSIDYLEQQRQDDIDSQKLAFIGQSWGARHGAKALALEKRFRVAVLVGGGLAAGKPSPELDLLNFLPRITIPTLMLNGRYDNIFPVTESQIPMFQALGTPLSQKSHQIIEDCGHGVGRDVQQKYGSKWLNKYLGEPKRDSD